MVLGIGTDIVTKADLQPAFLEAADPFCQATFTAAEQQEAQLRSDPHSYYAGRFAAKEAVFKALGLPTDTRLPLHEIQVLGGDAGAPTVRLSGQAAEAARRRGIHSILVSISHNAACAVAFALAQGEPYSKEEDLWQI